MTVQLQKHLLIARHPGWGARVILTAIVLVEGLLLGGSPAWARSGDLFDDRVVGIVEAVMDPADLARLLDPDNAESNEYLPARVRVRHGDLDERFPGAGLRLRGNYSRYAHKKGFKIALHAFEPGAEIDGISKLNLVGEHNDPCIAREKMAFDALAAIGVPASRVSHVRFYLNGEYRGLYLHVEEVDEAFLERRFGSPSGNLYKCQYVNRNASADLVYRQAEDYETLGDADKPVYELTSDRRSDSFTDLAELIAVINRTPDEHFVRELERVFDVEAFLATMAFDALSGSWDGYWVGANNYFLYHDPLLGRFRFIPRDLDMTFGLNTISSIDYTEVNIYRLGRFDSQRPLVWRMLEEDHYRNLFTFYVEKLLAGPLDPQVFADRAEELRTLIRPAALDDTYRTRDFPELIDYEAFDRAYDERLGGHVHHGLKPFMADRAASARLQIDYESAPPAIWGVAPQWGLLAPAAPMTFRAGAFDPGGLDRVEFHLDVGQGFSSWPMRDDGISGDGAAGDGIWGAEVPGAPAGARVRFYIAARDRSGYLTRFPARGGEDAIELEVLRDGPIILNELMARNTTTIGDEWGEFEDWIELWNRGPAAVDLGDYRLTDNPAERDVFALPALRVEPGERVLVWADGDDDQGAHHAPFQLDADGEWIGLFKTAGGGRFDAIDAVRFGSQAADESHGRVADGDPTWATVHPTPGAPNSPQAVEPGSMPGDGVPAPQLELHWVRPNPVRDESLIRFDLPAGESGTIDIVDVHGRIRRQLVVDPVAARSQAVWWNGRDGDGRRVPSGIYFLRLTAAGESRTTTLVVIR